MRIVRTAFGEITINGKTYDHDVIVRQCAALPRGRGLFAKKNCQVVIQPTPQAIRAFNEAHGKKVGLFHVTC
jgi:hypothetical protein